MPISKKIVVIGGTGLIGSKTVALLRAAGQEVLAASPSSGVNALTGEGLDQALAGAHAVIDVSNLMSFDADVIIPFFETSSRNLAEAGRKAGVRHHIALSIVGVDRLDAQPYLRAKAAQEKAVAASGLPYTIVRATQFFEFIAGIADGHTVDGTVQAPDGLFQPIAADDVSRILAETALGAPLNAVLDIAGPDRAPFETVLREYLRLAGDARPVVTERGTAYFGQPIAETSLVPLSTPRLGAIGLKGWFART